MPYIEEAERNQIEIHDEITDLALRINSPGMLNYTISKLIGIYLECELSYSKINEVVGVLECAKLELYKRIAEPYEAVKIKENGDLPSYTKMQSECYRRL